MAKMVDIKGENLPQLPFGTLTKKEDIVWFDGPILSHFFSGSGENILFYWVDADERGNRWLVFSVSESQLELYLNGKISLLNVIENQANGTYYTVEIGEVFEYKNIKQVFRKDLPPEYMPERWSFLAQTKCTIKKLK